ncbi:MAG: PLDc N-terminal domain-containing protein, partial [Acidimicrobiales bacterium]
MLGPGLVGLIALGLWLYAIFDVIATDETLVRNLPKTVWLMIVIFLSTIGALAWILMGRPEFAGWRPGDTRARPARRITGPDDDPKFLSRWSGPPPAVAGGSSREDRLAEWEEDLR